MDLFKAFIDILNKHCIDTTVVKNLKLNMVKFYYENKVNGDVRLNGFYNRVILMETITYISNDTNDFDISKTDSNDAIAIYEDFIAAVDDAPIIASEDDDIPIFAVLFHDVYTHAPLDFIHFLHQKEYNW
jgi:hypothetical protein